MSHPAVQPVSNFGPARRMLAMLGATMLAAGAIAVTAPADAAYAAPLACDQNTVFVSDTAGSVISVNVTTGATAAVTSALAGRTNALGVAPGGATAYALGGTGSQTDVLGIWDVDTPTAQNVPIPGAGSPQRGAIDPSSGLFYHAPGANNSLLDISAYRRTPATNIGRVAQLSGAVTGGGDFAFSQSGVLFVAAGANIIRANGPIPTTAPTGALPQISTSTVATLAAGTSLNGVAFSGDGYLYATTSRSELSRINPASGAVVSIIPFTGALSGFRPIDLASCNYANTTSSTLTIAERKQPTDQFSLTLTGGGVSTGNTATSTGAESSITAGPVPALGGTAYTVQQSPAGTTVPADYVTTWACRTASGTVVTSGSSGTAAYTQPSSTSENGSDISCAFTNVLSADALPDSGTTPAGMVLTVPAATGVLANDDGVGLEVTSFTQPANGSVALQPDGSYTFIPGFDFSGTTSFTYTAQDDAGNSSTGTVTLVVTPTADADSVSVTAGPGTTIPAATLLDGDRGTGLRIVSAAILTGGGSVTVDGAGDIVYTPAPGFSGPASFTYTVQDATGQQSSATVSVSVGPSAGGDSVSAPAGQPTTFTGLRANDLGDGLRIVDARILTGGGSVTVDPGGNVVYTPAPGYSGPASFTYDVRDSSGNLSTASVSVVVTPTAVADSRTAPAGATTSYFDLRANDLGTGLEITAVSPGSNGATAAIVAGAVAYTPAAGFSGTETFTYTATDDFGRFSTATVTVTVSPTARPDARAAASEVPVTITDLRSNDSGSALIITATTPGASGGVATLNADGSVTYRSADGFSGTDSFAYTVTDAGGATSTATVTMTVVATAANDAGATDAQTRFVVPAATGLLANDSGSGLEVTAFTQPANGAVLVESNGSYDYVPGDGFSGADVFVYTVQDDAGTSITRTVTVTVRPTAADNTASTIAGQGVSVDVVGNDVGTGLEITSVSDPAGGSASIGVAGRVDYTPDTGFSGVDTITYQVTDDAGQSRTATLTITVSPRALADAFTTPAGQAITLAPAQLVGNDLGTGLEITAVGATIGGAAALSPSGVVFQPSVGFSGTASFSYIVTDDNGLTATATVTVLVGNAATPDAVTVAAGGSASATAGNGVLANDSGTGLTAALDSAPTNGTAVVAADGSFTYSPAAGFSGPDTFTYTATDAEGQIRTGLVTVTVTPTAVDDALSTTAGTALRIDAPGVLGNDLGRGLEVTDVTAPANGTLTIAADGALEYLPNPGFSGTESVVYDVTDANGQVTQATLVIEVGVRAQGEAAQAIAGKPLVVPASRGLLANDEGAGLTARLATGPANGTAVVNPDGSYTYTPRAGFSGTDSFTYEVTDANGLTTIATLTLTVAPVSVGSNDTIVALPGKPVVIDPFANDSPTGGAEFIVSSLRLIDPVTGQPVLSVTIPGQGVWNIVDGKIVFTPAEGFAGVAGVSYEVTDTAGQVTRAAIAVTYPSALAVTGAAFAGANALAGLLAILIGGALVLIRRRRERMS